MKPLRPWLGDWFKLPLHELERLLDEQRANGPDWVHAIDELVLMQWPERKDYVLLHRERFGHKLVMECLADTRPVPAKVERTVRALLCRMTIKDIHTLCRAEPALAAKFSAALRTDRPELVPEGWKYLEERTLMGACLPCVQMNFSESVRRLHFSRGASNAVEVLPQYAQALGRIVAHLETSHLSSRQPRDGFRIPRTARDIAAPVPGFGWPAYQSWMSVGLQMVSISGLLLSDTIPWGVPGAVDPALAERVAVDALLVGQAGWLTLENLARLLADVPLPHPPELTHAIRAIDRMRIKALAKLAQLEKLAPPPHVALNLVRPAQYAWCALRRDEAFRRQHGVGALHESDQATMKHYVDKVGMGDDNAPPVRARTPEVFGVLVRRRHPELKPFYEVLDSMQRTWDGFDEGVLNKMTMSTDPALVRLGFRAAIHTGNLRRVRFILRRYFAKCLHRAARERVKDRYLEFGEEWRAHVCSHLQAEDLLLWADAVALVTQQMAPMAGAHTFIYRDSVRSLWKRLPPEQAARLEPLQVLYLHHVIAGLALHGLVQHPLKDSASWVAYNTCNEEEKQQFVEGQLQAIRFSSVHALRHTDFRQPPDVAPGDVLVSIALKDDHRLSIAVVGPRGRARSFEMDCTPRQDLETGRLRLGSWDAVIDESQMRCEDELQSGKVTALPMEDDIVRLFSAVIEMATEANPVFTRMHLHTQPLWRRVPWQYLYRTQAVLRDLCAHRFERQRRAGSYGSYNDFVVRHVPGVHSARTESALHMRRDDATRQGFRRICDHSDPLCDSLGGFLEDDGPSQPLDASLSRVSVVAHGEFSGDKDGTTDLVFNGMPWDRSRAQFAGHALAVLHACGAAHAIWSQRGDMGGLPGWLIGHGSRYVLGSPVVIPMDEKDLGTSAPVALERYLASLQRIDDEALEEAYMMAVRERAACAVYSLYGWEGAPTLRLPAR